MLRITRTLTLNTIFSKIAVVLVVCVGVVSGTITLVQGHFADRLTREFVARMADSNSQLVGDVIAGAVKFGKSDQVVEMFEATIKHSEDQIAAMIAIGNDQNPVAEVVGDNVERDLLIGLARDAMTQEQVVSSPDGLVVAVPLRFGATRAVVGAVANSWTPELFLARFAEAGRYAIAVAGAVFLIAVLLAVVVFNRALVRPLTACQSAIQALSRAQYDAPIPGRKRGDEIGQIARALEMLRDQLAESALVHRQSSIVSSAFSGSSAAMMIIDETMTISCVNPCMTELFTRHGDAIRQVAGDFDPESMVGRTLDILRGDGADIRRLVERSGGSPAQSIIRFGEVRLSLSINAVTLDDGTSAGHVLEWADVTELSLNSAVLDAIEADQIKAEFDIEGRFVSGNQRFMEVLGTQAGDLSRAMLAELMAPLETDDRTMTAVLAGLRQGRAFAGKLAVPSRDGATRTIDASLSCVKDHLGAPIRLLMLAKDVTAADAELALARADRAEAARNQGQVVDALRVGLSKLSGGDFTASIDQPFAGTYEDLRVDYNATVQKLASTLRTVAESAENIHNEACDISGTADGLSRRTESTAATLEETAAALDELTSSVHAAAAGAAQADQAVTAAKLNAEDSGRVVIDTVSAMDQIASSSEQITSIIKVIDDIAFQTNLLALNAGVEAARAGDAGRGFAVVASEVRALAQRSSEAAREINDLIAQSGAQVKTGVDLVGRTGDALHQIVESVSEISTLVSEIAGSSQTQSAGLAEINAAVTQLDQSTQQNAARLEEATAASEALRNDAVALVDTISQFKVSGVTRETGGRIKQNGPKPVASPKAAPKRHAEARPAAVNGPVAPPSTPIGQAATEWEDF